MRRCTVSQNSFMNASHEKTPTITEQASGKFSAAGKGPKWFPLIWLPYYLFFLLAPAYNHAPLSRWIEIGIGTVFFLIFYFGMFWAKKPTPWFYMGGLVVLGLIFAPTNPG